jgi:hypothetical protein
MLKYLLILAIPLFDVTGTVRFKQQSHADPKDVIETVRTAFPHAHCDFNAVDSVYAVDNFVNFDEAYFINRMQQFGVQVALIVTVEK